MSVPCQGVKQLAWTWHMLVGSCPHPLTVYRAVYKYIMSIIQLLMNGGSIQHVGVTGISRVFVMSHEASGNPLASASSEILGKRTFLDLCEIESQEPQ